MSLSCLSIQGFTKESRGFWRRISTSACIRSAVNFSRTLITDLKRRIQYHQLSTTNDLFVTSQEEKPASSGTIMKHGNLCKPSKLDHTNNTVWKFPKSFWRWVRILGYGYKKCENLLIAIVAAAWSTNSWAIPTPSWLISGLFSRHSDMWLKASSSISSSGLLVMVSLHLLSSLASGTWRDHLVFDSCCRMLLIIGRALSTTSLEHNDISKRIQSCPLIIIRITEHFPRNSHQTAREPRFVFKETGEP